MQYALIITQVDSYLSEQNGALFRLNLEDHLGRKVSLLGAADQQVNIQTIRNQLLPIVMLADHIDQLNEESYSIPHSALVSVVPLPSGSISSIIEAGRADEILQSLSLKAC